MILPYNNTQLVKKKSPFNIANGNQDDSDDDFCLRGAGDPDMYLQEQPTADFYHSSGTQSPRDSQKSVGHFNQEITQSSNQFDEEMNEVESLKVEAEESNLFHIES